ncbi:hypothetical protein F4X86_02455 [Candidatus Saccharibacteria bacterium]|nr:hypothetical protein [Candidatus Saccharibacteria bacterium]
MSGNSDGGRLAAATIRAKHGRDFYVKIGQLGGRKSRNGGFASPKVGKDGLTGAQRAKLAGARGGAKSRRGKATAVRRINVKVL